jgi:hypothetical protein
MEVVLIGERCLFVGMFIELGNVGSWHHRILRNFKCASQNQNLIPLRPIHDPTSLQT